MVRNEAKAKSARRPLRDLPNNKNSQSNTTTNNGGKFSKSISVPQKSLTVSTMKQQQQQKQPKQEDEDYLDRLLLAQSDLSSLTRQIDELVAQAFDLKSINQQGKREIESFCQFLSDMLTSLKPWVPRFRKALSNKSQSPETENRFGEKCLTNHNAVSAVNEDEKFEVQSPEQTGRISMISPSPLVSWKAGCDIDRGRQFFLLTPLPMSKTFSSKRTDLSKSVLEGTSSHPVVELQSFQSLSEDINDDLLQGVTTKLVPVRPSDSVVTEAKSTPDSPAFTIKDHSMLVMTPCLKMSPPRSCVLLEPFSDSTHEGKSMFRKATPFPIGLLSKISESSSDSESEDLALKYPELLGLQQACKSKAGKQDLEASPDWLFSPPKTCILMEPPDGKSLAAAAIDSHFPVRAPDLNQQTNSSSSNEDNHQGGPIGARLKSVENTPMWKEPESIMQTGKRAGENTLKKELWTRFDAATSYGARLNVNALQKTARKGFLDMLDEVSCDEEEHCVDDNLR
ncbi:uncharacterized protein LOC126679736 isoform X3 [Mercurialis annua]|uniref:uncharacterized protein LOC126679736 isoform X3 n=1 Tax=Mercurialis annua TaxID=3986 RepID=UPI0024ACA200|nr:uncharacterized protein LOC126679736 isoform X3 [Mercurialis annua]